MVHIIGVMANFGYEIQNSVVVRFKWYSTCTLLVTALHFNVSNWYPSTVNIINVQQCMNYMFSTL